MLDGGKALRAALRKYGGAKAWVQRCQLHKRRNVCGHLAEDEQRAWDARLAQAYNGPDYAEAQNALSRIHRELMHCNPSAARSLEKGLEETKP